MEQIKSIFDELAKWQEENKENRGVLLIAVERTHEDEEHTESQSTAAVIGTPRTIVMGVKSAMKNAKPVRDIIRRAIFEQAMDGLIKSLGDNDKETPSPEASKGDNAAEQGKE